MAIASKKKQDSLCQRNKNETYLLLYVSRNIKNCLKHCSTYEVDINKQNLILLQY